MKADDVRTKLKKYLNTDSDTIILEVLKGKPRSSEGGVWVEADVATVAEMSIKTAAEREASGWQRHFDKWKKESLITDTDLA